MRPLLHFFVNFYPRWWRERYGAEFHALIEDDSADLSSALNILPGALRMRLRTLAEGPLDNWRALELPAGNWRLLAFSSAVQAGAAAVYLTFHAWTGTALYLGSLELAAGTTAAAAGLLNSRRHKSWPLVLNGLAFLGLGFIHSTLMRYPIRFSTLAALVMIMTITIGLLALRKGRTGALAAIPAIGFFAVFFALSVRWIPMAPGTHMDLICFGLYFAFSAMFMLGLALKVRWGRGGPTPI